jgi:signal transduction histidine kinase
MEEQLSTVSDEPLLLKVFDEVARKLVRGASYEKVLEFVFNSLNLTIPYDRLGIARVDDAVAIPVLRLEWVRSKLPVKYLERQYSAPLVSSGSLAALLANGQPRVINDLIAYANQNPTSETTKLVIRDGIRSSLTCPLRIDGKAIGVLFFSSATENTYQTLHVDTFLRIADELAHVVEYGKMAKAASQVDNQSKALGTILHDLRSPLGVIQGFSTAALDEPWFENLDEVAKDTFRILIRNSDKMFDLINELLTINYLDRNVSELKLETLNLKAFCNEIAHLGSILVEKKHLLLETDFGPDLDCSVRLDKSKMTRALENFLTNAIKFSKPATHVRLAAHLTHGQITFSVKDEGPGIPIAEQGRLFSDFGRTSVQPTAGEVSTGLGLSIVKRLVEQHSGDVGVKSQVGFGSEFWFTIPAHLQTLTPATH